MPIRMKSPTSQEHLPDEIPGIERKQHSQHAGDGEARTQRSFAAIAAAGDLERSAPCAPAEIL